MAMNKNHRQGCLFKGRAEIFKHKCAQTGI